MLVFEAVFMAIAPSTEDRYIGSKEGNNKIGSEGCEYISHLKTPHLE